MSSMIFRVKDPTEGSVEQVRFRERSVVLGRARDCEIVLTDRKVSGHHAEVSFVKGKLRVRDLGSRDGVFVNGERIEKRVAVTAEDLIEIGRFRIRVALKTGDRRRSTGEGEAEEAEAPRRSKSRSTSTSKDRGKTRSEGKKSPSKGSLKARRRKLKVDPFEDLDKSDLLRSEVEAATRMVKLGGEESGFEPDSTEDLESSADEPVAKKKPKKRHRLIADQDEDQDAEVVEDELEEESEEPPLDELEDEDALAPASRPPSIWDDDAEYGYLLEFLSPVRDALLDPAVTEVMINGPEQIFVEREGRLIALPASFPSDAALLSVAQNIAQSVGRPLDAASPIVDARLPDGSRVNCVIAPCARKGTYISIRKFLPGRLTVDTLLGFDAITQHAADFIEACVRGSLNIIVTGGTGSGKTTLLNVVSDFIPETERILVIEDASELRLNQSHVLPMETRPADPKTGKGQVSIRDLLRASLRLRPDRIIIGELRGEEAFDLLQAFNTGHRGSMTTLHSNAPKDCLSRLEMLVTLAGLDIPLRAIREQIASAVDVIVYTARMRDGSRKITHISEVLPLDNDGRYRVEDIFRFHHRGVDPDDKVLGKLEPTGRVPSLMEHFLAEGMKLSDNFFAVYEDQAGPTT